MSTNKVALITGITGQDGAYLAEHLGLRTRDELLAAIDAAGLKVLGRQDVKPTHPRVADTRDALHAARAAEMTSLWRLG